MNRQDEERAKKLRKTFDMLRRLEKIIYRPLFPYKKHGNLTRHNDGPLIIIGNHYSIWDVVPAAMATDRAIHFMAKDELGKVKLRPGGQGTACPKKRLRNQRLPDTAPLPGWGYSNIDKQHVQPVPNEPCHADGGVSDSSGNGVEAAGQRRGRAVGGVRRPADGFTQRIVYGRGQVIFIQRHRAPRFVREKPVPVFRPLQVWPSQKAASAWKTASAPGRMARWLQWGGIRRR